MALQERAEGKNSGLAAFALCTVSSIRRNSSHITTCFEKETKRTRKLEEPPIEGHSALLHDPGPEKKLKSDDPKFAYIVYDDGSAPRM
jgi:hypothetical protein